MSEYRDELDRQAFGTFPTFPDRLDRDEEALPLSQGRPDGVYFHMQDRVWRIQFGGTDRFETFGVEEYDAANTLFKRLKEESGEPTTQD